MATTNNAMTEMVTITIPFDRDNKSDVYVEVNGKSFQIKRGSEVTVPKAVSNVLKRQQKMQMLAAAMEDEAADRLGEMEQ